MISKGVETAFNKVYYLIKLSLYFWGMSFIGLVIFGITPALLALIECHEEAEWDYSLVTWKKLFTLYKQHFKRGNQLFLLYVGFFLVLGYNLFLSVQTNGVLFLMIDFLLLFVLFLLLVSFFINLAILTNYEISLMNSLKLALIQFFTNTKECFILVFGLILMSVLTYKFPGLFLFITMGLLASVVSTSTKKMFQYLTLG